MLSVPSAGVCATMPASRVKMGDSAGFQFKFYG
jgi:hypothetical protein